MKSESAEVWRAEYEACNLHYTSWGGGVTHIFQVTTQLSYQHMYTCQFVMYMYIYTCTATLIQLYYGPGSSLHTHYSDYRMGERELRKKALR